MAKPLGREGRVRAAWAGRPRLSGDRAAARRCRWAEGWKDGRKALERSLGASPHSSLLGRGRRARALGKEGAGSLARPRACAAGRGPRSRREGHCVLQRDGDVAFAVSAASLNRANTPFRFLPSPTEEARGRAWGGCGVWGWGAWGSLRDGATLGRVGRRVPVPAFVSAVGAGRSVCGRAAAARATRRLNLPPIRSALCRLPCPRPKQSRCLFSQPRARSGRHVACARPTRRLCRDPAPGPVSCIQRSKAG